MNVTVFCDDDVSIVVNITNRTKAEEVIRQIITLRRSMTALADVETDECTLSIDAEGSRQLLSRKSLLMSLLTSPPIAPLQPAYRITALGFRAKAAALSRAAKDRRYLIERKMLELQHLAAAHGSQLSSQLAPLLQIADSSCRIAPDTDADNNKSSSSSSSNKHYKNFSSSESDDFSPGVSIYGDLQKNYDDFALNVRKALAAWRITLKGSGDDRTIFDIGIVEDFLRKRNIEGLLFCAAQFDSYRGLPIQTLLRHELEIIDSSSAIKSKHTKPMPVVYESSIDRNVEHIVSHTAAQAQQIPESESNSGTKMPAEEDDDSSSVTSSSSEGESSDSDEEDENTVLITPSTLPPLAAPIAVTMADGLDIAVKELVVPISVAATSAAPPAVDNMEGSEYETESEGSEEDSSDEEAEVKAVGKADPLNTTAAPILIIASDAPSAIATTAVPSDAATATAASVIAAPIAPVAVTIAADANITVVAPEANIAATDSDAEDDYYRTDVINYDDNDSEDAKDSDDGEESDNKTPPILPKPTVITKVAKVTTNARTETAVSKTSSYDADTSSSSSGEEEDENEEGTASEDEEVKKPPLALLELLYKKPTAKFASCFLPAKQKRAAVTATAAAFAAAAAAKKIADKERALKNSITSGIGSSQLNVTGIEGTLDPLSDASGFKIAASISLPDTAIQIEKDTTPITALASTDNTSELPPTEAETEKALEAVVPTLHIATVAVLPDATTEMETPPLPHNPAPSEITKKVEISHASSSSECSSDSTLTDDSSSDESDVEVEVLSTTASGSNSQGSHILQQHSGHRKELPIAGIPDTLLPSSSSRSNGAQVDQDPSSKKQKINDTRNLSLIGPISSPPDTTTKSPKKFPVNLKSDEVKKSARSARKLAKEKREIAASPTARKHPVGKAPTQLGIGKVKASSTTRARKKPVGAVAQLPQIQSGSSSIAGSAPLNAATKVTTAVVSSKQTAASKKKGQQNSGRSNLLS